MDSEKPKRPMSAYMMWLNSNRDSLKAKHPELKGSEFNKKCAGIWKSVDQSVWKEKAAKVKKQYEVDMDSWKNVDQEEKQDGNLSSVKEESESHESGDSDIECSEPDPKKIKRTYISKSLTSAYNLWLKSARASIEVEHPGLKLFEIAEKAGQIWKAMTKEEKNVWKEKAAKKQQSEKDQESYTITGSDEEGMEEGVEEGKVHIKEEEMTFEEMSAEDLLECPDMAPVTCAYHAEGRLHPQDTGFFFVPESQSSVHIGFEDITNVKFSKSSSSSTISFNIDIALNSGDVRKFSNISKSECDKLRNFMSSKNLQIKNDNDEKDDSNKEKTGKPGVDLLEFEGSDSDERDVNVDGADDATKEEDIESNPMYGFMTFLRINRDSIIAKNPDLKDGETILKAGEMWRAMDEAEKKTWFEKAAKAKAQFLKDLEAYYKANIGESCSKRACRSRATASATTPGATTDGADSSESDSERNTHNTTHEKDIGKKKSKARQAAQRSETPPEETDAIDPDGPRSRYCLCDEMSYGEMILCDNDLCPIEWFHFSCVSLTTKPKGKWFCPKCRGDRPNVMKPKSQFLKELKQYNREKGEKA